MSYGWLTESALLPTRAVPIRGVSDSSLFSLSNQIFSLQQEQQEQQQQQDLLCAAPPSERAATAAGAAPTFRSVDKRKRKPTSLRRSSFNEGREVVDRASGGGASPSGSNEDEQSDGDTVKGAKEEEEDEEEEKKKRRRKLLRASQEKTDTSETESPAETQRHAAATQKVWKRPSRKPKTREELLFEGRNARVEERAAKDEVEYKASEKTIAASRRRLEEKARLYEELISGRLDCSSAPAGACLVVDFEEKQLWRRRSSFISAPSIKDTPHPTEELKTKPLSPDELEGNADLLSGYCSPEAQERRQKERQKTRRLRLDCLRSRLTSLREAAFLAPGAQAAATAGRHPGDFE